MLVLPRTKTRSCQFPIVQEPIECDLGRHMSLFAKPVVPAHLVTDTERQICPNTIEGHQVEAL